ncbi:MAG: PD40 domain-containing protein [Gemmatimonadales bacterium]|nr:PD40 domain-containing protein [Gemmatimonadales bacterium]
MTALRPESDRTARRRHVRPGVGAVALRALAPLHLLALAAGPAVAQAATEVQVTPETMTLGVGQRQPIFAAAYDRQGNLMPSARFTFWSSDTVIARVSREGTVQGVAPGLAKVEARTQGKRASLAVLITGSAAGHSGSTAAGTILTLDPASAVLLPGERLEVTPQALHEDGTPVSVARVSWRSLKPEVANVDSSGVVLAVAPGRSIVQATTAAGLMATVSVEVEPAEIALAGESEVLGPEEAETLRVEIPSQAHRRLSGFMEWRSADTTVAVVGPTGIVQARRPGRTEIVVLASGQERRTTLVVHRLPQTLVVSPKPVAEPLRIPLRAARTFTAVAEAADSTPIPEARITWEVGDTTRAGFDRATGTLVARDTGSTTLTARMRGFEPVVWRLQLVPGVLGLDRTRAGLHPGEQITLSAALLDDDGKIIGPAAVEWSTDRPEIAAVAAGQVRGVRPGHALVSARSAWGTTVAADVYVTAELLVASNRGGSFDLYQIRPESPDTLLPLLVDGGGNVQPVRSPDRTRIAFSSTRGGSYDLYVMDADGTNPRRLTADPGAEGEPVWAADGARIVYTAAPSGAAPQLVSVRADGNDARAITASPGGNRAPAVSPDGRRLAFVSTRDGNAEIYETDIDGGAARRMTRTSDRESSPRYLPDGDLVFVVAKGDKSRLMRLPAGGAAAALVLEIDQPVLALDVSGDGKRLAYVAGTLAEGGRGKSRITLRIQPLAADGRPVLVPLRPGEQALSPSF